MEKVGIEYVYHIDNAIINIGKVEKGLQGMEDKAKAAGSAGEKGMKATGLGAATVAKGILIATAALALLKKGWAAILDNMPMLGQTMDQIGKIIGANLLYPLAKELMPVIISLFKWVREHRIQFVEIGTILVSVFRLLKTVIAGAFENLTSFWNGLTKSMKLGKVTLQDVIDFINLAILKVALVFFFLQAKTKPLFEFLGSVIGGIYKDVIEPFINGIVEGFNDWLVPAIEELGAAWDELKAAFGPGDLIPEEQRAKARIFFKYVGIAVMGILTGVIKLVTYLVMFVKWIIEAKRQFDKFNETARDFAENLVKKIKNALMAIPALLSDIATRIGNFLSGILTKIVMNLPFSQSLIAGIDLITSTTGEAWKKMKAFGRAMWEGFKEIIKEKFPKVAEYLGLNEVGANIEVESRGSMIQRESSGGATNSMQDNRVISANITISGAQNPLETGRAVQRAILDLSNPRNSAIYDRITVGA